MELQHDEKIILYVRKHWIFFVLQVIPLIFMAIIPAFFPGLVTFFLPESISSMQDAFFVLYGLWLIILWVWAFELWTKYYLDMWVLTTHKIMSTDQRSLFNRYMATLELEKIQDVTVEVNGFIETMLGYGTLRVQTAGEMRPFVMEDAAQAEQCKQIILDTQARVRENMLERQGVYMANGINTTL